MPQIANQDYNVIDFTVIPYYEAVERLYRAYLNGTAFDCIVNLIIRDIKITQKIIIHEERTSGNAVVLIFNNESIGAEKYYVLKAPLATDNGGYLVLRYDFDINIVSADGFKLKPVVKEGVLTGVEVTTVKVENDAAAQYFKDWMIGQPVTQG